MMTIKARREAETVMMEGEGSWKRHVAVNLKDVRRKNHARIGTGRVSRRVGAGEKSLLMVVKRQGACVFLHPVSTRLLSLYHNL
ncbi:hypothetical protein Hamer_G030434 [Homarus americanus]|uniref:Uncharacterized protein n=1 Tax=Homarus americanus TaxID=6706 RepID=A0A8J5JHN8_HOMAM|nr:hypothetical protein Hamer_G030434 [Homarus americanus]